MEITGLIVIFKTHLIVIVDTMAAVKFPFLIKLLVAHGNPLAQNLKSCSNNKLGGHMTIRIMSSDPVNADYRYENFSNHGVLLCCG